MCDINTGWGHDIDKYNGKEGPDGRRLVWALDGLGKGPNIENFIALEVPSLPQRRMIKQQRRVAARICSI